MSELHTVFLITGVIVIAGGLLTLFIRQPTGTCGAANALAADLIV